MNYNQNLVEKVVGEMAPPSTLFQLFLTYGYDITLFLMALFVVWRLSITRYHLTKPFWVFVIVSAFTGWMSGYFLNHYDPIIPAWFYFPFSYSHILDNGLVLEDWVFYPLSSAFFYIVAAWIPRSRIESTDQEKALVLIFYFLISQYFLFFGGVAGKVFTLQQTIPGMVLMVIIWDKFDVGQFMKVLFFVVVFAGVWDYFAVDWIVRLSGWEGAAAWNYVFDGHSSSVYCNLWIGKNPVEVTPYMSITSAIYIYTLMTWMKRVIK